jgi:hypothetical protein
VAITFLLSEVGMKRCKSCVKKVYRAATFAAVAFMAWKLVRHWHTGLATTTGRTIDASIGVAAEKLEKTAVALEQWAAGGKGEHLGKGLDEVLSDTKKTLEKTTALVQGALNQISKKRNAP